jgi:hypothetical protein
VLHNALIKPINRRRIEVVFTFMVMFSSFFTYFTRELDTRVIYFEIRTQEMTLRLYDIPGIGEGLLWFYNIILSDWYVNKIAQGALIGILLSIIFIYYFVRLDMSTKFVRGVRRITGKELRTEILDDLKNRNKEAKKIDKDGYRLTITNEKIPIPLDEENRSFFIAGKIGAGKTQAIFDIVINFMRVKSTLIFYDVKPDYWIRFYRHGKDSLFLPTHKDSIKWNIFDEIMSIRYEQTREVDIHNNIKFITNVLIPESNSNTDKFWESNSRSILEAILLHIALKYENPTNKTFIDFLRKYKSVQSIVAETKETIEEFAILLPTNFKADKTIGSIEMSYKDFVKELILPEFYFEEGDFTIDSFIESLAENSDKRVFLVQPTTASKGYSIYFKLFIELMAKKIMSLENEKDLDGEKIRRIIFVLDEFQKLGKITTIEELLTVQRSKGGSTILATQSIAKLEDIYGKLLTLSLIQNLSTKVIMQYDEQIGNDIFTKILGKQEVVENNENRIVSQNHTRDTSNKTEKNVEKNIIIDGELSSLKPLSAFIRISNYPIGEVSFKYREITPINKLDESNIYTPLKYEIFEDNMEVVEDVEILITQEDKIPDYAMPLEEHYIGNECNIDGSETQIIMNDNFNSEWEFKDER